MSVRFPSTWFEESRKQNPKREDPHATEGLARDVQPM
jgi:hypothetical protein